MSCSAARLLANQRNAQRSTGPKTAAGKAASRQNALQHGLTGAGVVVPGEDAAAIDQRFAEFALELAGDGSQTTRLLAQRMAILSVRMERSVRHDTAVTAERLRVAQADLDAARAATARDLWDKAATDPAALVALRDLPEGIHLLLATLQALRPSADPATPAAWTEEQAGLLDRCLGSRAPAGATTAGEQIDAELARLEAHWETLDHEAIARQDAGVVNQALVDDSPATLLARKYEAATERSIHRTLKEIRQFQAQRGVCSPPTPPDPAPLIRSLAAARDQVARLAPVAPTLGSLFPGPTAKPAAVETVDLTIGKPAPHGQSRHPDRKKRPKLR